MTCFCPPRESEPSAVFLQFELQWMLIHCDPLRPRRETCHELPARITVSPLTTCKVQCRPAYLSPPLQTPHLLTLFLEFKLYCTDQINFKEAQVPPKAWQVETTSGVPGSTFGGLRPSLLLPQTPFQEHWRSVRRPEDRERLHLGRPVEAKAEGGTRSGLARVAAGKGLRGTVVILSVLQPASSPPIPRTLSRAIHKQEEHTPPGPGRAP